MPAAPAELDQGRYRLLEPLGAGGMATVWRAWDERLQVERAVKILTGAASTDASLRARFLQEARTMARLRHPHILTVYDTGSDAGHLWTVMDLVKSGSLADRAAREGPLSAQSALRCAAEVLSGLAFAHAEGVVHRDIKPANVLIAEDGTCLIADFGIAHLRGHDHRMTATGAGMGSLAYMAPEQLRSARSVDGRADLYAVGASLFALVTGAEPFDLAHEPLGGKRLGCLTPALAEVIWRATRLDPADRFPDAEAMREAVLEAEAAVLRGAPKPPGAEPTRAGDTPPRSIPPVEPPHSVTFESTSSLTAVPPAVSKRRWGWGPALALAAAAIAGGGWAWVSRETPAAELVPKAITALPPDEGANFAALTPDGKRVIWGTPTGLWVKDLPDGPPTRVPYDAPGLLFASPFPDGQRMLVSSTEPLAEMAIVDVETGAAQSTGHVGRGAVVSPDGGSVAYESGGSLYILPLTVGSTARRLPLGGESAQLYDLAWSPDGTRLAVALADPESGDGAIAIAPSDGSEPRIAWRSSKLFSWDGMMSVAWTAGGQVATTLASPDGRGAIDLVAFDPDTAEAAPAFRPLGRLPFDATRGLSVVGERVAFVGVHDLKDIYVAPVTPAGLGQPTRLTLEDSDDGRPLWLSDGSIAFQSKRGGEWGIYAQRPGERSARPLTAKGYDPLYATPEMVVGLTTTPAAATFRGFRLAGGEPLSIATCPRGGTERGYACAPNGVACVVIVQDGEQLVLRTVDLANACEGKDVARLTGTGMPFVALSTDGKTATTTQSSDRITLVPLDGAAPATVVVQGAEIQQAVGTPDGSGLWLVSSEGFNWAIERSDLSGNAVVAYQTTGWLLDLRPSPDGSSLAFTKWAMDQDVYLLDPLPE